MSLWWWIVGLSIGALVVAGVDFIMKGLTEGGWDDDGFA